MNRDLVRLLIFPRAKIIPPKMSGKTRMLRGFLALFPIRAAQIHPYLHDRPRSRPSVLPCTDPLVLPDRRRKNTPNEKPRKHPDSSRISRKIKACLSRRSVPIRLGRSRSRTPNTSACPCTSCGTMKRATSSEADSNQALRSFRGRRSSCPISVS